MAARFVRLRITGFKSFAEPATVEILPGLTGVVGPNGCGKSNVAEALRWAMGESNARSLRGGEMDDVIFAGTAARPSRNLAEVALTLEGDGDEPGFDGHPELQVVRRIERGGGSFYRVNGRETRARDVQTLFADLASGARSSAMISQGRVSAIVAARPDERRMVLEEAAGITGLHGRRAEAEGKLRAAEQNLERTEQERGQLEAQLAALRRQAAEAERYRAVCAAVHGAETALLSLVHARAQAAHARAKAGLEGAARAVVQAEAAAGNAEREAACAAAALPALRETDAAARILLERARVGQQVLAADAARAHDALSAASARCEQLQRDLSHAMQVQHDAASADARLAAEAERLGQDAMASPARLEAARAEAAAASEAANQAEAAATEAAERAAALSASTQAAAALLDQAASRARRTDAALARLAAERVHAVTQLVDPARIAAARQAHLAAEAAAGEARIRLEHAEAARAAAAPGGIAAREAAIRCEAVQSKLAAEVAALAEISAVRDNERWPPMLDQMRVPPGLETALGAALGEDLVAAADPTAARHWRELPLAEPPAPPGQTLAMMVDGPAALSRALGAIGFVADDAAGDAAHHALQPGQSLVSAAGAVWRWDGYTVRAGTPSAATVRLQQRNRLAELRVQLDAATAAVDAAQSARIAADAAEREAGAFESQARPAQREGEQQASRTRQAMASLQAQAAVAAAGLAGLDEQIAALQPEAAEAAVALAYASSQRAALPNAAASRAALDGARAALVAARSRDNAAARTLDAMTRDAAARTARQRILLREREDWRMRTDDAAGRLADLRARTAEAEAERARMAAAPGQLAHDAAVAAETLRKAEGAQCAAALALDTGDRHWADASLAARTAEQALSASREALARVEAAAESAAAGFATIREQLGPNDALGEPPADLTQAAADRTRNQLDRLIRDRDAIGPVNLRAEIEAAAVSEAADARRRDQDELATAIAKLRGSIGHLNREGRERLTAVFQRVDRQFQALFARMFGGGRAHLAFVGSDDPLDAGLEIYAQPPGKKLTALSLLSGGEQALTALSLVFAVFRCNPAPLCVLDEVDAPLDDANVDRFCALLADMVHETGTRFLVVTHHQLTMARMDRLYGVTMQERGVSRLLAVDLHAAVGMMEAVAAE